MASEGTNETMVTVEDADAKDEERMTNVNIEAEEKRILRIITKIQSQRNRACYQNVLEFAGRENKDLNMDICKAIIDELVEKKNGC